MGLIVQKYGGTSVANPDRVKFVAEHVAKTQRAGNDVVVVVSAPAGMTDDLTHRASQISEMPSPREMDRRQPQSPRQKRHQRHRRCRQSRS